MFIFIALINIFILLFYLFSIAHQVYAIMNESFLIQLFHQSMQETFEAPLNVYHPFSQQDLFSTKLMLLFLQIIEIFLKNHSLYKENSFKQQET